MGERFSLLSVSTAYRPRFTKMCSTVSVTSGPGKSGALRLFTIRDEGSKKRKNRGAVYRYRDSQRTKPDILSLSRRAARKYEAARKFSFQIRHYPRFLSFDCSRAGALSVDDKCLFHSLLHIKNEFASS